MPVPTCPVTVIVDAPDAEKLAAFNMTVANPVASVNAVPETGENTPKVESVVNVTTTPEIGAPVADLKVALTFAGLTNEIEVRAVAVVSSVRVIAKVGVPLAAAAESFDTAPLQPLNKTAVPTKTDVVKNRFVKTSTR